MAVAPFFAKSALSAAQVLSNVSQAEFIARMETARIAVVFGDDTADTAQGRTAAELLTNLLARLLPSFALVATGLHAKQYRATLEQLALSINPLIDVEAADNPSFLVVLGEARGTWTAPRIHVGSDAWTARLASDRALPFGPEAVPFGAAAAACLAAANCFRFIFRDALVEGEIDRDIALSLWSFDMAAPGVPPEAPFSIGEVHLAGVGAIGNGLIWTLGRLPSVDGTLHVVDPEVVELSNLQRYVLTDYASPAKRKTKIAAEALSNVGLTIHPHDATWGAYLAGRNDHRIETIAVALDSALARIEIQGCLPRRVFNAWTQRENLGVSRHENFGMEPCLACLYLPDGPVPSEDEEIMRSLKLGPEAQMEVRVLLHSGAPVSGDFIARVARLANKDPGTLDQFVGKPLRNLYSGAVCGGLLLDINGPTLPAAEVPMPFQSALAGVMLAAELVAAPYRRSMPTTTTLNVLRPLSAYLSFPRPRRERCLCSDPVMQAVHHRKWPANEPAIG